MSEDKEVEEYKRKSYSLTDKEIERLVALAKRRSLNNSSMLRTLINEEWERIGMNKEKKPS